jgi:hypothetical protein
MTDDEPGAMMMMLHGTQISDAAMCPDLVTWKKVSAEPARLGG